MPLKSAKINDILVWKQISAFFPPRIHFQFSLGSGVGLPEKTINGLSACSQGTTRVQSIVLS